jgi:glycosyltransferase involved in cell wall biosynthesis
MGGQLNILVVVHESSRTGAPRIGGLIASALQETQDVDLISLSEGPLENWLQSRVHAGHFSIVDRAPLYHRSFEARLNLAQSFLENHPAEIVYVSSLAASEYLVAAKAAGKTAVLHLHEKKAEIQSLLRLQRTKSNILSFCDAVVLASGELLTDMMEVFGKVPQRTLDWGIALDFAEIFRLSKDKDAIAETAGGRVLADSERLLVGMVGYGSARKGADIFYEVAKSLPEHDFIWVGNWDNIDVPNYKQYASERLKNFYVCGDVENPYKYIKRFDLFFLSSREDPNPIVLAEAMLLQVPIFCFAESTSVRDFLGRNAILLHGSTNSDDAIRFLRKIDKAELKSGELGPSRNLIDEYFNVNNKVESIIQLLKSL